MTSGNSGKDLFGHGPDSDDVQVVLPCTPENFADFISSLLGNPQTLSRRISIAFKLDHDRIISLHELIRQRLDEQNRCLLSQFSVKFYYDDGSSTKINSFEQYRTFRETRPVRTIAVDMNWILLVLFEGYKNPQRQEINIQFCTPYYAFSRFIQKTRETFIFDFSQDPEHINFGYIEVQIHTTARTWGGDVDNIIKNELIGLAQDEHPIVKFAYQNHKYIGIWTTFVIFFILCVSIFGVSEGWRQYSLAKLELTLMGFEGDELNREIATMLFSWSIDGESFPLYHVGYVWTGVTLSFFLAAFAGQFFAKRARYLHRAAEIVLTSRDEKQVEKQRRKDGRAIGIFFVNHAINIIIAIVAAVLFI